MQRKMSLQHHKRKSLRQHPQNKLPQNTTEIPFEDWRLLQTKPHTISMDADSDFVGSIHQTSNSCAFTEAALRTEWAWFNGVPEVRTYSALSLGIGPLCKYCTERLDNDLGEDKAKGVRAMRCSQFFVNIWNSKCPTTPCQRINGELKLTVQNVPNRTANSGGDSNSARTSVAGVSRSDDTTHRCSILRLGSVHEGNW